ncbi:MAG: hypothetical protein AAF220_10715, partial [Pseudomonadota bacterium]
KPSIVQCKHSEPNHIFRISLKTHNYATVSVSGDAFTPLIRGPKVPYTLNKQRFYVITNAAIEQSSG